MKGYSMKKFVFLTILISALMLYGCTSTDAGQNIESGYTNISVETLEEMMNERRDTFVLINTHIPFQGNLPDTDLSIPYNEILENLDQLPEDKDAEIVLYCRSDNMSHAAAADLVDAGYTNVKNLVGGFVAWQAKGLPMEMTP